MFIKRLIISGNVEDTNLEEFLWEAYKPPKGLQAQESSLKLNDGFAYGLMGGMLADIAAASLIGYFLPEHREYGAYIMFATCLSTNLTLMLKD